MPGPDTDPNLITARTRRTVWITVAICFALGVYLSFR